MTQAPYNFPVALSYANIPGITAGTLIKGTGGLLQSLVVNSATAGAVVTIYDGTSTAGTVIAAFTAGTITNPQAAVVYGVAFLKGLFVVVATDAADLTFTYH